MLEIMKSCDKNDPEDEIKWNEGEHLYNQFLEFKYGEFWEWKEDPNNSNHSQRYVKFFLKLIDHCVYIFSTKFLWNYLFGKMLT